jgi:HlyD family secretion protein
MIATERRLLHAALTARAGQRAQLAEQITQIERDAAANATQERAHAQELVFADRQLAAVRDLWERRLVSLERLSGLERENVRLQSSRSQLGEAKVRAEAKIAEIRLQVAQIDHDLAVKVGEELRSVEARLAQLVELRVAADQALVRAEIRAPQAGIVHQSTVHTVGGVVMPDGQPLMLIVPENEELTIEAMVRPQDVDQIALGDAARIRLSAFNQRTTPVISGTIKHISADVTVDPATGQSYYTLRIAAPETEIATLPGFQLIPGMPVEVFVETDTRSVLSYVLKPLDDQLARAFREH